MQSLIVIGNNTNPVKITWLTMANKEITTLCKHIIIFCQNDYKLLPSQGVQFPVTTSLRGRH